MQHNLVLTDIMGYGNGTMREKFIRSCTLPDQAFTFEWFYYNWMRHDLKKFDRKFACLDMANNNVSVEFQQELLRRVDVLANENFFIILSNLWETDDSSPWLVKHREILKKYASRLIVLNGGDCFFWHMMHEMYHNKQMNFDHSTKKYNFLFLNKTSRPHRKKFYDLIKKSDVLDSCIHSFLDEPHNKKLPEEYELPWVDRANYPRVGYDQQIFEKPYNDSGISIVSESMVEGKEIFLTEKIWKPIIAGQPFVVHGQPLYLQHLRSLGFQTFNNFWDESYDCELDFEKRTNKLFVLLKTLSSTDWNKLYADSATQRLHNINNFFNKERLIGSVNEKILGLLKFADRG